MITANGTPDTPQDPAGWIGSWSPGIGDPTFLGWLTVACYFLAAGLCWRARGAAQRERLLGATHRNHTLWTILSIGLLFLGFNKQLDLQSAATELGRLLAIEQGWYSSRRSMQLLFVIVVATAAALVFAALLRGSRRDLRRLWLALAGASGLCAFIIIRAASFHHVDHLIGVEALGAIAINHLLEIGGTLCIAAGSWHYHRAAPVTQTPPSEPDRGSR